MKIGVLIDFNASTNITEKMNAVREMGLQSCQICFWDASLYTAENAASIRAAAEETGIEISTLWAGWSGPMVWDFYRGPLTLGLVPVAFRAGRLEELKRGGEFAARIGVNNVATHVGFIPENPNDPDYLSLIAALAHLAGHFAKLGINFLFETGQETPTTLVRAIEDIGAENVGINFDTANLIIYGKARSLDAVKLFGKYVRDLHCKDGEFPTGGRLLGGEKPLGQGKAEIREVIRHLLSIGYDGPLTIEREISGEQQIADIIAARDLLCEIVSENSTTLA